MSKIPITCKADYEAEWKRLGKRIFQLRELIQYCKERQKKLAGQWVQDCTALRIYDLFVVPSAQANVIHRVAELSVRQREIYVVKEYTRMMDGTWSNKETKNCKYLVEDCKRIRDTREIKDAEYVLAKNAKVSGKRDGKSIVIGKFFYSKRTL